MVPLGIITTLVRFFLIIHLQTYMQFKNQQQIYCVLELYYCLTLIYCLILTSPLNFFMHQVAVAPTVTLAALSSPHR